LGLLISVLFICVPCSRGRLDFSVFTRPRGRGKADQAEAWVLPSSPMSGPAASEAAAVLESRARRAEAT